MKNILLIRMQDLGEVAAIALPALRYYQAKYPDAKVSILTHGEGVKLMQLAEPSVEVIELDSGIWPEQLLPAMEAFLGLAEKIVGQAYDQIINLDTTFMPNFLARFLKDAGEPVIGNTLTKSVNELIEDFQNQTLSPEFVQQPSLFMQSSFFTMQSWYTRWWEGGFVPEGGYPEYYLNRACGFGDISMNDTIDVQGDNALAEIAKTKPVIALATKITEMDNGFPFSKQLQWALEEASYHVITEFTQDISVTQQLCQLKQANLLITLPRDTFWLAKSVGCPRLLLAAGVEPASLMAEYTIEQDDLNLVEAHTIVEMVKDILTKH